MKRTLMLALCLLLLSQVASSQTPGIKLGVGVFGGLNYPLVQNDQASGTVFGFKGRVKLAIITLEPNVAFAKYGSPDIAGVIDDPEGSKMTSFGLDALLGSPVGGPGLAVFVVRGDRVVQDQE